MRSGEIALAAGVEQVLDAVEVEEEGIAAGAGGSVTSPAVTTLGCDPNDTSTSVKICSPIGSGERDCSARAMNTLTVCRPSTGEENTKLNAMSLTRSPSVSIANR